jgi:hypothetical protein
MSETLSFLAGAGLGAGLMYMLDPDTGRRRRALARDKAVRLAHEAEDAAEVVARDATNRARGLAAGDLSVLVGGKRALSNPLRGAWSPTGRALLGLLGGGLFLYGLTRSAPTACVLGCAGIALAAEAVTNVGFDDLARIPEKVSEKVNELAPALTENVGLGEVKVG